MRPARPAKKLVFLPAVLFASSLASPVFADPPPRVVRMVWAPDGRNLVLVTNRGLIFGDEQTKRFRLMCNDALDLRVDDIPTLAYLADGRLLAAGTTGLKVSADSGCSWQGVAPFAATQTPAMAQHPIELDTLYLATYGAGEGAIRVTYDGGQTFSEVLPLTDTEFIHSLLISPANPQRIYATGVAFDASTMTHSLLRSPDAGATWERFTLELASSEERATLVTLHPTDENELLIKTTAFNPETTPERLLLSRDGGATFTRIFFGTRLSDASYGPDAVDLWVTDALGLWRFTDGLSTFARHGAAAWMSCVEHQRGRLWGCGQFAGISANKDGIGVASKPEDPFFPWMDFQDVYEPVACSAGAPTPVACEVTWAHWQVEVLGGRDGGPPPDDGGFAGYSGADAGALGSGGSGGGNPPPAEDSGCAVGVSAQMTSSRATVLLLGALAALRLALRRRAREVR
jgi:hypothetical protein